MKKLELIIESVEEKKIIKILDNIGIKGYSIIKDVRGRGKKGERRFSELTGIMKNLLFIVVDEEEKINSFIEEVKPILKDYSGIMILSEVTLIKGK